MQIISCLHWGLPVYLIYVTNFWFFKKQKTKSRIQSSPYQVTISATQVFVVPVNAPQLIFICAVLLKQSVTYTEIKHFGEGRLSWRKSLAHSWKPNLCECKREINFCDRVLCIAQSDSGRQPRMNLWTGTRSVRHHQRWQSWETVVLSGAAASRGAASQGKQLSKFNQDK